MGEKRKCPDDALPVWLTGLQRKKVKTLKNEDAISVSKLWVNPLNSISSLIAEERWSPGDGGSTWSVQLPGLVPSRNTSAEDVFRCSLITLLRAYEMSCFGEASITVLGGGITFGNQTARSSVSPDSEHSTMRAAFLKLPPARRSTFELVAEALRLEAMGQTPGPNVNTGSCHDPCSGLQSWNLPEHYIKPDPVPVPAVFGPTGVMTNFSLEKPSSVVARATRAPSIVNVHGADDLHSHPALGQDDELADFVGPFDSFEPQVVFTDQAGVSVPGTSTYIPDGLWYEGSEDAIVVDLFQPWLVTAPGESSYGL